MIVQAYYSQLTVSHYNNMSHNISICFAVQPHVVHTRCSAAYHNAVGLLLLLFGSVGLACHRCFRTRVGRVGPITCVGIKVWLA